MWMVLVSNNTAERYAVEFVCFDEATALSSFQVAKQVHTAVKLVSLPDLAWDIVEAYERPAPAP